MTKDSYKRKTNISATGIIKEWSECIAKKTFEGKKYSAEQWVNFKRQYDTQIYKPDEEKICKKAHSSYVGFCRKNKKNNVVNQSMVQRWSAWAAKNKEINGQKYSAEKCLEFYVSGKSKMNKRRYLKKNDPRIKLTTQEQDAINSYNAFEYNVEGQCNKNHILMQQAQKNIPSEQPTTALSEMHSTSPEVVDFTPDTEEKPSNVLGSSSSTSVCLASDYSQTSSFSRETSDTKMELDSTLNDEAQTSTHIKYLEASNGFNFLVYDRDGYAHRPFVAK